MKKGNKWKLGGENMTRYLVKLSNGCSIETTNKDINNNIAIKLVLQSWQVTVVEIVEIANEKVSA